MKTSRRQFIKSGAMAMAGAMVLPRTSLAIPKKNKGIVGLQLYSVRTDMQEDPLGSLKKLADMGYVYLEHANYINRKFYGYPAAEFKKILDDLGLRMVSGHTVMGRNHWNEEAKDFSDSWKMTIEDAATLQQKYVISPSMDNRMRRTYDDLLHYMEIFNKCGELCMKSGMKFGYHNHDFEFSEKLNDEIPASGCNEKYESCILGEGIVNARKVVDMATKIGGTTCYIIEQESYQDKTPMECVMADLAVMKKWKYV
jgi:hypothetical protein